MLTRLTELYRKIKPDAKSITLQHAQHMNEEVSKWANKKDKDEAIELLKLVDAHLGALDANMPEMSPFYKQIDSSQQLKDEVPPPPDDFRDNTIGSDEEFDFGDDEINPLRIDAHINYENTTISSFSNINNVIHENNTVASMVSSLLVMARDTDLTNKDTSDKYIDRLLELLKNRQI